MDTTSKKTPINRYSHGNTEEIDDLVIIEQPVSLTVNSKVWLTFMCTPIDLKALAAGFLYNEKIISKINDIADIRVCEHRDNVDIWLNHSFEEPTNWRRTSGCTGGYTAAILEEIEPVPHDDIKISSDEVLALIQNLIKTQDIYRKAGGVHASALASKAGILLQTEDVGRHNTLDKIAGRMLLEGIDPETRILLSTGRISSEMLQKAARLRASILISRTSPTSLSIDLAERLNITLVGYARGHRFNIYSCPRRIITA
jgi:FdhD protein